MEIQNKVQQIIADVMEIPVDRINLLTQQDDIEEWDSLGQLKLIMRLEHELGIKISMAEVPGLNSVKSILDLVLSKMQMS